jgi:putative colanic acid biosysnthesis UDP-glucose lipid carrier transferase
LLAARQTHRLLLGQQLTPAALVRVALEPFVSVGSLLVCTFAIRGSFEGPYLILALIVFSLTFPGRSPREAGAGALAAEVLTNWLLIVALLVLIGWTTRTLDTFDQRVIVAWALLTPFALLSAHLLMPVLLPRLLAAEGVRRTAVIGGAGNLGRTLARQIEENPDLGIRLAGYFDDRTLARTSHAGPGSILGSLDELPEFVKTAHVDLIYITLPMASQPRIHKLLEDLHDTTASIYFAPDIFLFDLIQARMDTIGDMPVISVCETPFYGVNGLIKRVSDILLAAAILALVSPLMLAIAAGIKHTSPGPVLFRQRRYGIDGREIVVYKFRSMTVLEDGSVIPQATSNDRRVTRFGAFLRRTSLDELPQFINVLQGRMSVVGPRPHAVAHNEMYRKMIRGYMIRHKVKPGITGLAQVNGMRGETDQLDKMAKRIEYDLAYLRHWSLWLDLRIVLRTIPVVLQMENAH